jgi:hypothetical protein
MEIARIRPAKIVVTTFGLILADNLSVGTIADGVRLVKTGLQNVLPIVNLGPTGRLATKCSFMTKFMDLIIVVRILLDEGVDFGNAATIFSTVHCGCCAAVADTLGLIGSVPGNVVGGCTSGGSAFTVITMRGAELHANAPVHDRHGPIKLGFVPALDFPSLSEPNLSWNGKAHRFDEIILFHRGLCSHYLANVITT